MRTFPPILVALLLSLSVAAPLRSQWKEANGPYGANIRHFATAGSAMLAGGYNCLYVSRNSGGSWARVGDGFPPSARVQAIEAMGDVFFVAAFSEGIFHSCDGGETWTVDTTGTTGAPVYDLSVAGSEVFAAMYRAGVVVSRDSGKTWLPTGPSSGSFWTVKAHDSLVFAGYNYCSVSTDRGGTWSDRSSGLPTGLDITAFEFYGNLVFAGTAAGVFVSSDTGRSWSQAGAGLPSEYVYSLKGNSGRFYACTGGGLYSSPDSGKHWSAASTGIIDTVIYALEVKGDTLFLGTYSGIFRSTDEGATWLPAQEGLRDVRVYSYGKSPSNLYCATGRGLFRSSNDGVDWTFCESLGTQYVGEVAVWRGSVFVDCAGEVLRSDDDGASWTAYPPPRPGGKWNFLSFAPLDSFLFAGSSDGRAYRLKSGDTTWQAVPSGLTNLSLRAFCLMDSTLYAGGDGGVFSMPLSDTLWTRVWTGLGGEQIRSLAAVNGRLITGTDLGIFVSTDRGATWTTNSSLFTFSLAAADSAVFAGTDNGVYLSRDYGQHWLPASEGLSSTFVYALTVAGSNLLAGTERSVWMRSVLDPTLASVEERALPEAYALSQNYPNPFNPSTTIRYAVPHRSHVELVVFNTLGQRVATLVNGEVEAGYHQAQFSASTLASGVYFYRITAGAFTQVRKVLLVR